MAASVRGVAEHGGEERVESVRVEKAGGPTATNMKLVGQVAHMAAFPVAAVGRLVLVNGWEWCESAHTVVISIAQ